MSNKTVRALGDYVNYQEGAVVSREIIKQSGGTITVFAFDKNQGLSEHKTPFTALVYLLDGEAEITVSGESHQLRTGETLLMPANQPHALKAIKAFKMLLVMLRA